MKIGPTDNPEFYSGKTEIKQLEAQKNELSTSIKDTVEISQSGREKLRNLADQHHKEIQNDNSIIEQISPKLARIKNKIEAGYYDLEKIGSKITDKLSDTISNEIDNNKKME